MSVISIENISKSYRIRHGAVRDKYDTLRDSFAAAVTWPLRKLQGKANGSVEEFWALKDVNLEIRQGEVVGFIGRNGAGKSTLLKILSRITPPTTGCIRLRGRVGSLLEVGTGFHPELTGRENIYLNGSILGMSRREIQAKFDEIVEFSGIEQFLDTPVKRYSSGMYVRLAFAVAAHLEPEILIVDEVLAVGDSEFQRKCLGKMSDIAQGGQTVLFVSHNMTAVQKLCKRVIILAGGKISADGVPADVVPLYVQGDNGNHSKWERGDDAGTAPLQFDSASVELRPGFGAKKLCVELGLSSRGRHKPAFVAVDILDPLGIGVMQAIPRLSPFIKDRPNRHRLSIEVDLPPLIPGSYQVTLWVGSHNSETLDQVDGQLRFEVLESPTPNRTFPHTPDHGYIVPSATVEYFDDTAARVS